MIKLENNAALPQARALVVIESRDRMPAISLGTEEVREEVNGNWVTSQSNVRQILSAFVDGKPLKLSGKVAAAYAVECSACHKVLVEVEVKTVLTTAFEKGDKSRESVQVSLIRVVEVWSSAEKQLWSAKLQENGNSRAVDVTAPVGRAALAGGRA